MFDITNLKKYIFRTQYSIFIIPQKLLLYRLLKYFFTLTNILKI